MIFNFEKNHAFAWFSVTDLLIVKKGKFVKSFIKGKANPPERQVPAV